MKILINCVAAHKAGTFTLSYNLLKSLCDSAEEVRICALVPAGAGYENLHSKKLTLKYYKRGLFYYLWRIFFDQIYVPCLCRISKFDILLNMNNIPIRFISIPQVLMLHQPNIVMDVHVRQGLALGFNLYFQRIIFRLGLKYCDSVIVQTPVMKKALSLKYKYPETKISVIKSGYVSGDGRDVGSCVVAPSLQADRFRLLCVSHYYPAKNLEVLLEVARLAKIKGIPFRIFLTVDQKESKGASRFVSKLVKMGIGDYVINMGRLTKRQVLEAYKTADAFILPTMLESFGLIYLEAMANEVPILTSNLDFAKWVCGDAAVYFDPRDPGSVLCAIERIMQDETLRRSLIEKGKERLRCAFNTWDNVAKEYLNVLYKVVSK